MQGVISWLSLHWQDVLTTILGIDVLLIPIFPNVSLFQKIKSWLSGIIPPKAS